MIKTHDAIRAHMEGRLHKNPAPVIIASEFNKKEEDLLAKSLDFILRDPVCRLHLAIASVKRANAAKPMVKYLHYSEVEPITKRRGRPPGRKNK